MRFITSKEIKKINPELRKRFGAKNVITSGTVFKDEKGITQYNIVLNNDNNFFRANSMLRQIGKNVRTILGADEVYYFGERIA